MPFTLDSTLSHRRAVILFLLITTALFADILFTGNTFWARDTLRLNYPADRVLRDVVMTGDAPLWNPRWSGGQPLAANPGYAAFYPGKLLLFLPSFDFGFRLQIIIQFAIAAIGMFLLLRSLGARPCASFVAAISFAFGGMLASYANILPFIISTPLLPWIALFGRRAITSGRGRDIALASLVLGILLLTGEVSLILQTGLLIATYAAWRHGFRGVLRGAMIVVFAAGIAAVQIVPAIDFQRDTLRGAPMSYENVTIGSMSPLRPLELIWPKFFSAENAHGRALTAPFTLNFYCGLAASLLLIAGLLRRVRGWAITLALTAISFAIAIGEHGPLFPLLYRAGMRTIRFPEKFFTLAIFLLCVFAGVVLDRLLDDDTLRRIAVALAIVVAAISIAMASTAAAITAAAFAIILAVPLAPSRRAILIAVFVAVDVLWRFNALIPRAPLSVTEPPAVARAIAHGRVYNDFEWRRILSPSSQPRIAADALPWFTRDAMLPQLPTAWGFETAFGVDATLTNVTPSAEYAGLFRLMRAAGRTDRANLLLVLAGVTHVFADVRGPAVFRVPGAPAYFASEVVTVRDAAQFRDALMSQRDFSSRVAFAAAAVPCAPGSILAMKRTPRTITLDINASGDAFLVLATTAHRYWAATIDGRRVPIVRTNLAYQGVRVPRGRHRVVWRYENPVMLISGLVSILALGVAVALRSRESRPPSPH